LIGSAIMLVNFVFFSTFLRWTISSLLATNSPLIQNQYLYPFYATFAVIAGGFAVALILVGRVLSHRIAGPLFAFERFLFDLLAGKDSPMKLRAGDEFRHLEELSEELRKRFKCNSDR
jgi:signal peptidase II